MWEQNHILPSLPPFPPWLISFPLCMPWRHIPSIVLCLCCPHSLGCRQQSMFPTDHHIMCTLHRLMPSPLSVGAVLYSTPPSSLPTLAHSLSPLHVQTSRSDHRPMLMLFLRSLQSMNDNDSCHCELVKVIQAPSEARPRQHSPSKGKCA